jgi:hypothetical protein
MYTPKPGDRVLIPATVVPPTEPWVGVKVGGRAYDVKDVELLPDERPVDPDWWPPQPGDVAIRLGVIWTFVVGMDRWETVSGTWEHRDDMRGADLIARGGKRWPS